MNTKIYFVVAMLIVASIACSALDDPTAVPPAPTQAAAPTLVPTKPVVAQPTAAPAATKPAASATQAPAASGYVTLKDASGALTVDVPATWKDTDGKLYDLGSASNPLPSARIRASTNLADYDNYKADGLEIIASATLARLGGYLQVLDILRADYMTDCKYDKRYTYKDDFYEGSYDILLNCKNIKDQVVLLFSGRPIKNPTSFLIFMAINFTKDGSTAAAQAKTILDSFDVVGSLPR